MKHYKKEDTIIVELSPIELMTEHTKVWKALPFEIKRQLWNAPHAVIRLINQGDHFRVEYET